MSIVQEKQSHVFPGIGLGALGGLVIQGFRSDTVDKKTVCASVLLGGILGGVIGKLFDLSDETKSKSNKKEREKKTDDSMKKIIGKGVVYVHCADKSKSSVNYEDIIHRELEYTYGFQYATVKKALEIAQKTKSVQEVFNFFKDGKNSLIFIENDFTQGGLNANISSCLKDGAYIEYGIKDNYTKLKNKADSFMQKYFFNIEVKLFPKNGWSKIEGDKIIKYTTTEQIASLLVVIGHELFIHDSHFETAKLWKLGKYQESIAKAVEYRGINGYEDHKLYMQKKKSKMTKYLTELKNLAYTGKLGIPYNEIVKAIKRHDDNYK